MYRLLILAIALAALVDCVNSDGRAAVLAAEINSLPGPLDAAARWPEPTNVSRPWTRWWWLGSAVDSENLTRLLETYHAAGLGGVEITALYGIRGAESRELPYLSPQWVAALRHSVQEAKRLGMGVDLPTGSGWRTGGPRVAEEDQNLEVKISKSALDGGTLYGQDFNTPPQALVAYGENGEVVDLTDDARDLSVRWQMPAGRWTIYTVVASWSHDNVKRPAPGGEGRNINPLSKRSVEHFLDYFARALGDAPADGIRCQFHDSYEYEGNWCDDFFAQFEHRRGYRLQDHLPALNGEGDQDEVARVKCDYRETVSDLVLESLIEPWTDWSHTHGMLSRNQSHGSPANWLDLYEACDIPEIESFGRLKGGDTNRLVFMFAPSAAHVSGKRLVSSESATWLEEHFNETLGEVKEIVDRLFLGGVNHVIYHGTAYSPDDVAWPGWLFYASTELNPQNPLWRDFPAVNEYVTRCQSLLQTTRSDNDVLLYWPIYDYWHNPSGLRKNLQVHNSRDWLDRSECGRAAKWLEEHGYAFDYISDRQLAKCSAAEGQIETSGKTRYAIVLVPGAKLLPLATLESLVKLAKDGATVGFLGSLPTGPPGLVSPDVQAKWDALMRQLQAGLVKPADDASSSHSQLADEKMGVGRVLLSSDWSALLNAAHIRQDWLGTADHPLKFQRRAWDGGNLYFIKNDSDEPFDAAVEPAVEFDSALVMDPLDGRIGTTDVQPTAKGARSLRLQLAPHQSIFVKTYRVPVEAPTWKYRQLAGAASPVDGLWSVEFIAGGPNLPPRFQTQRLASWTELAGPESESFAGTARYSIRFSPDVQAERYLLDLGQVAESARVTLNGQPVATRFGPPFQVEIGPLLDHNNLLTIEVTNVAANRIRDLDRRKVDWKIFKDINFVNINYRPFDASNWPVREAGLLGPVTLTPLAK